MAFCSQVAQAAGFHPVGTAPTYMSHLVVECPLPWEREVAESETFPAEVAALAARAGQEGDEPRITGIMPDPEYSQPGLTRLFYYTHTDSRSPMYAKREFSVPPAELPGLVEALLFAPGESQRYAALEQHTAGIREVLVCNHGSRDRCCATFGFQIYRELRETYARRQPESVRVWRCSHLGGHRMSPTLLDFPTGRYYAYVSSADLPNLIQQDGAAGALDRRYRGWSRLSPLEQTAEHAVWLAEGWRWTTYEVASAVTPGGEADGAVTVQLDYTDPASARSGTYRVVVREAPERLLHFPSSCGKEVEPQPQFVVERVDKLQ